VEEDARLFCKTNAPWKKCLWKPPRNGVRQVKELNPQNFAFSTSSKTGFEYMIKSFNVILLFAYFLSFCPMIFFTFQAQSLFEQAAISLSFLPVM